MKGIHTCVSVCALVVLAGIATVGPAGAVEWKVLDDSRWCRSYDRGYEEYCEVREATIPANRDVIAVDGRANGGVEVEGWERDEIRILAKVTVWDRDDDEAREIADRVEIIVDDGDIHAEGPRTHRRSGWSVSYRIMVPERSNLDLVANNGGIGVLGVHGRIRLETTNGGLSLSRVSGDVSGRTTNGGLDVELDGDKWNGEGLDVRSTNGGVSLEIPREYSADLVTGTVNGAIHVDFPITVEGTIDKNIRAKLGDGGPSIVVRTTNGGVHISRI